MTHVSFQQKAALALLAWMLVAPSFASAAEPPAVQATAQGNAMNETTLTGEAADHLAIRELIDAWAHDADRRQAAAQAALFTEDGTIEVYTSEPGPDSKPVQVLGGRAAIESGIRDGLKPYAVTMHVNGQSMVQIHDDQATNESYTIAHHFWTEHGQRMLLVMGIRYHDSLVRQDGHWLFARRQLVIDWTDRRPSTP